MSEMVVPEGWEVVSLSETSIKKYGIVDGPFGSNLKSEHYRESGVPVIQSGFVTSGKFFAKRYIFVDTEKYQEQIRSSTSQGDVVMAKIGANAGACAILPEGHATGILAGNSLKITVNESIASNQYIVSLLHHYREVGELGRIRTETAQPAISISSLKKLKIPLPPLPEQKKIASILTSVDDVIEKTQSQINKLQDLKNATINALLTRGIGHTEFKDSPFGRIPKGWEVLCCNDVCRKIGVGIATSTTHAYTDHNGVVILRNQNIKKGKIDSTNLLYITHEFSEQNSIRKLQKGDVISARTGYTGISAVVSEEFVGCHSFTTLISRPKENLMLSAFYALFFNSQLGQNIVKKTQAGGAQQNLNVEMMKLISIPVPPLQEQQKIASILSSIDSHIEEKQRKLEQTKSLKKSLMQDLLTGKVRVTIN